VTSFAGNTLRGSIDGVGSNANFYYPNGAAINPIGTLLYVSDTGNNNIRTIVLASGNICTKVPHFILNKLGHDVLH
jgi:DNA-binding beta-propeller fold protein YncE